MQSIPAAPTPAPTQISIRPPTPTRYDERRENAERVARQRRSSYTRPLRDVTSRTVNYIPHRPLYLKKPSRPLASRLKGVGLGGGRKELVVSLSKKPFRHTMGMRLSELKAPRIPRLARGKLIIEMNSLNKNHF